MKPLLKVLGASLLVVVLGIAAFAAVLLAGAIRPSRSIAIDQAAVRAPGKAPTLVTLVYPTTAAPKLKWLGAGFVAIAPKGPLAPGQHPLVLISHGTGGGPLSHLDTAIALADAGYVVAAPVHRGDNVQDQSAVGTPGWISGRAEDVASATNFVLQDWTHHAGVDANRVGVFGFSAGATTALVAIGGTPDLTRLASHCATSPELVCELYAKPVTTNPHWTKTPQIRAAVAAAPGLGFTFAPKGLAEVNVPVQIWQGDADRTVPPASNAEVVRELLPPSTEFHLVRGAGHLSFLAPCGATGFLMPRDLCADAKGFDRAAFHKALNASVVAFFNRELGSAVDSGPQ